MPNRNGSAVFFLLPAIALALAPVAAAGPEQHWVSLCTGDGARLVRIGDGKDIPGQGPEDRGHGMCAHATSPREIRARDRARTR